MNRFRPATLLVLLTCLAAGVQAAEESRALPQFSHQSADEWINSQPLGVEDLLGKVLIVDVWTFDCWNCYRSIPWLHSLERRFGDAGLEVVGVHTPEFDHERVRSNVEHRVEYFGITHPVMLDNDFSYWNALGTRAWPSFYVVDRTGRIRGSFVGETHAGDARARRMEALIEMLLAERPVP